MHWGMSRQRVEEEMSRVCTVLYGRLPESAGTSPNDEDPRTRTRLPSVTVEDMICISEHEQYTAACASQE